MHSTIWVMISDREADVVKKQRRKKASGNSFSLLEVDITTGRWLAFTTSCVS